MGIILRMFKINDMQITLSNCFIFIFYSNDITLATYIYVLLSIHALYYFSVTRQFEHIYTKRKNKLYNMRVIIFHFYCCCLSLLFLVALHSTSSYINYELGQRCNMGIREDTKRTAGNG